MIISQLDMLPPSSQILKEKNTLKLFLLTAFYQVLFYFCLNQMNVRNSIFSCQLFILL